MEKVLNCYLSKIWNVTHSKM